MASDGDATGDVGAKPSRSNGSNPGHSAHLTTVRRLSRHYDGYGNNFGSTSVEGWSVGIGCAMALINMLFYPLIPLSRTVAAGASYNVDLR